MPTASFPSPLWDCAPPNSSKEHASSSGQDHAKTHVAAVILHVQRVMLEPERFGEVIHDFSDVIERVHEFLWGSGQSLCPKPG
jgi:hypothetical protein